MARLRDRPYLPIVFLFSLISFSSFTSHFSWASEVVEESCECQNSSCGPCEIETGVDFYSAKCGPANSKVKSCKKPSCAPVQNQNMCLAQLKKGAAAEQSHGTKILEAKTPEANLQKTNRTPASAKVIAGEVTEVVGSSRLIRGFGHLIETPKAGLVVFVGDVIETKTDGRVKFLLKDSSDSLKRSEVIVPEMSKIRVEKMNFDPADTRKKVLLKLIQGKIRSQVKEKYNGANTFEVQTRTAVAGVRGTDFVVSFEKGERQWISAVRTLHGQVRLESARSDSDAGPSGSAKMVDVPGGGYASFVVSAPIDETNEFEVQKIIEEGQVSPVLKMKESEIKELEDATQIAMLTDRKPASNDEFACSSPSGHFNQCSYTCEGNPAGAKKCRTDLQGVRCTRRLCRANGQWGDAMRLPSSQGDFCESNRPVVRDCSQYW